MKAGSFTLTIPNLVEDLVTLTGKSGPINCLQCRSKHFCTPNAEEEEDGIYIKDVTCAECGKISTINQLEEGEADA